MSQHDLIHALHNTIMLLDRTKRAGLLAQSDIEIVEDACRVLLCHTGDFEREKQRVVSDYDKAIHRFAKAYKDYYVASEPTKPAPEYAVLLSKALANVMRKAQTYGAVVGLPRESL